MSDSDNIHFSFDDELVKMMPKLRVWGLAMTQNKANAEDLMQSTMVKALAARNAFEPGTNFSAWIHKIMFNHFISGVRGQREFTDIDERPDIGRAATQTDRYDLIQLSELTERLPEDQRAALQAIVIDEQTYEQVSKATGAAIGTLKSRVHRARLALRAAVNDETETSSAYSNRMKIRKDEFRPRDFTAQIRSEITLRKAALVEQNLKLESDILDALIDLGIFSKSAENKSTRQPAQHDLSTTPIELHEQDLGSILEPDVYDALKDLEIFSIATQAEIPTCQIRDDLNKHLKERDQKCPITPIL